MTIRATLAALALLIARPVLAEIPIQDVTSPGGIHAWLVEDHGLPFTALEIRFRGGTSLDRPGKRGEVMLMTSLLEEGSGKLDSRGFAEARDDLAAKFSFDASADTVSVSARFLTENRDQALDLLRVALSDPHFDPVSTERVKGQIYSIIDSNLKSPEAIASDQFSRAAYGDHPYGSDDMGSHDSVQALTRDDLLAAKAASMARDRLYVSAVGDIDAATLGQILDRLLGDLPAKGAPLPQTANVSLDGKIAVTPFETPQSVVIFGQPGIKLTDPDYYAAFVLNQIIGGSGFAARLMDEVREKRGLTYGVSTDLVGRDLAEIWAGSLSSSNDKVAEAIKVIRQVWADTAAKGVTEAELEAAKTYMTGSYPLRFDGNAPIASILVGMQMEGLPIDYPAHRNDKINAVTLADVNRVAKQLMDPGHLSFTVVGQPEGLE